MAQDFGNMPETLESPIPNAFVVATSDVADLAKPTRAIQVAVDGLVYADFLESGTNVPVFCIAGIVYPFMLSRIYTTSTAATVIVGRY